MKSSFFCLYRCRILNNWKTTTLRLLVCRCLKTISKTADVRAPAGGEEKSRDKMSVCSIFVQFFYQYLMTNSWWCCYNHPHLLSFFKYLKQLSLLMKASLFWGRWTSLTRARLTPDVKRLLCFFTTAGKKSSVSFNECKSVNFSYITFSEEGTDLGCCP